VLGIDTSALQEALGIQESTLRTWLTRSGAQSRKLHERFFKNLVLAHIQLDELWAKVKEKEQAVWVWTVCEAKTKIIPVIQLGARTQEMAYSVVHELKSRFKVGYMPIFSSDGLKHYFYGLIFDDNFNVATYKLGTFSLVKWAHSRACKKHVWKGRRNWCG
jgi:IS1 family transposase